MYLLPASSLFPPSVFLLASFSSFSDLPCRSSSSRPKNEKADKQDTPLPSPQNSSRSTSGPNMSPFLPRITPSSTLSPSTTPPAVATSPPGHTSLTLNGVAAPSYSSGRGGKGERQEDGGEARVRMREGDTNAKLVSILYIYFISILISSLFMYLKCFWLIQLSTIKTNSTPVPPIKVYSLLSSLLTILTSFVSLLLYFLLLS